MIVPPLRRPLPTNSSDLPTTNHHDTWMFPGWKASVIAGHAHVECLVVVAALLL